MAKKATPGDFVPDRKSSGKHNDTRLLPATIAAPVSDDGTRAQAALYLHETGHGDLWEVLGLMPYLDSRRLHLGLAVEVEATGPTAGLPDVTCPDCHAGPGKPCRSGMQGRLKNWHIGRRRLAARMANTPEVSDAPN